MYKKKLLSFALLGVCSIVLSACAGSTDSKKDTSSSSSSAKNEVVLKNTELRNKFNSIKVGDIMDSGNGGSTLDEVKKSLGKPTKFQGTSAKTGTWTKNGVTIMLHFVDDKVVTKDLSGFKFGRREEKLTLDAFNQIQTGASYDEIIKNYGEPDSLNELVVSGETKITAIWLTGIKGSSYANATLQFTNGQLTSKTQSELK